MSECMILIESGYISPAGDRRVVSSSLTESGWDSPEQATTTWTQGGIFRNENVTPYLNGYEKVTPAAESDQAKSYRKLRITQLFNRVSFPEAESTS
ncbi:hypothetical protein B7R22_17110 [Subtercola boreus]|uniref:Uncharacterized protein n=1 Tax=Subtercola boreus TaxID=120213 RepID=A0A3E0VRC0_9MICO|nr:hypothetical protein [Subtercola boreus]RFA12149.1 hypothetical protein B7R22_17110 [Subtercola boreus]